MKKIVFILSLMAVVFGLHAQMGNNRILVTYFSWSGSTKALAEEIQRQTKADIYRIEPLVPYSKYHQRVEA